jgi:hypothetical protein
MKRVKPVFLVVATSIAAGAMTLTGFAADRPGGGHAPSGGSIASGHSVSPGPAGRSFSPGSGNFGSTRGYSNTTQAPMTRSYGGSRTYAYGERSHRHRHGRRFYGYGYLDDDYPGYGYYAYGQSCDWLRHRALATGSRYWWNRYYACINA